jgi:RHS repeat-associated protein
LIARDRLCGGTYRIITDNQGSVRLVVDAETGKVAQRLDYDSFGRVLRDTNPGFQPFGFQGGLYDPDTGLVEFGCRWYDAETGRWISKDPILLDGGWNVYAFCGNDPINRTDPSGLYSFWQWTSQVIGAVTGAAQALGGFGLALTTGISGVGAVAGIVVGANGLVAMTASIHNIYQMSDGDDAKLWGNTGMIGLTTSLATESPTLNMVAGYADVCVNWAASPIAFKEAVTAVGRHFAIGTYGRMLWDSNHYGTFGSVDRLMSAEEIAQQLLRPIETAVWLSRIGTAGSCIDATLNIIK